MQNSTSLFWLKKNIKMQIGKKKNLFLWIEQYPSKKKRYVDTDGQ